MPARVPLPSSRKQQFLGGVLAPHHRGPALSHGPASSHPGPQLRIGGGHEWPWGNAQHTHTR
eukprot:6683097-Prorocentrum_lima.AAC.1